jgi:hypothetical protein
MIASRAMADAAFGISGASAPVRPHPAKAAAATTMTAPSMRRFEKWSTSHPAVKLPMTPPTRVISPSQRPISRGAQP